jgi:hypothetical protein
MPGQLPRRTSSLRNPQHLTDPVRRAGQPAGASCNPSDCKSAIYAGPPDVSRGEDGRGSNAPFPVPAHQTGRADFPHPAFRPVSPRAYGGRSIRALFASPPHLGTAVKLAWKALGLMRCFVGSRQVTDPRLLQQAHQKSGSFPPPALPGLNSTTTPSDPHLCRRLSASLRPLPSLMMGLPRLPASPFQRAVPIPRRIKAGALVDCFPAYAAFPVIQAGRHPQLHFRGLLRLHSRYGPLDCSTAQGGLCHEASTWPVTRPSRSSATRSIDNSLDGSFLHW